MRHVSTYLEQYLLVDSSVLRLGLQAVLLLARRNVCRCELGSKLCHLGIGRCHVPCLSRSALLCLLGNALSLQAVHRCMTVTLAG